MKSARSSRFQTEQQRRDAGSAVLAVSLFFLILYSVANVTPPALVDESGKKTAVKFETMSEAEYEQLMSREMPAVAPEAAPSVAVRKAVSRPAPKPERKSVLAKTVPPPAAPKIEQAEFKPSMAEPQMWEADRSDMEEKSAVQTAAVDLPKPVAEPEKKLSEDNPEPIEAAPVDVKQNVTMAAKTKDLKSPAPAEHADYKPDIDAPADVARKELAAASEPTAAAPRAEFPQDQIGKIQKEVARKITQEQIAVQQAHTDRAALQNDPNAWKDVRQAASEKHAVDVRSVDLPAPVKEKIESLAADRPSPIQHDVADVKPTAGVAARSAAMPVMAQQPVAGNVVVPQSVDAPREVVRRESTSDYQPRSAATPNAVAVPEVDRIARNVSAPQSHRSQVQVASTRPPVDLPEVSVTAPVGWKESPRATVTAQHAVRAGAVALPAPVADARVGKETLSDRSKPVEIALASIKPDVELRQSEAAGPANPVRPEPVSEVVPNRASAPVSVVRKKDVRTATAFGAPKQVDGLKVTEVDPSQNPRAPAAVSTRAAVAPQTAKAVEQPNFPQSSAAAPDKWVDPSRAAAPALLEKTSINATPVNLPDKVVASQSAVITTSSSVYDIAVETVKSEFDVLPLSARPAPASPSGPAPASSDGDGSGQRKLIKSEEIDIPQWYEEKGVNSVGTFRVHIAPNGDVQSVEVEKTTGFKEIDAGWISAITNWKYESGRTSVTKLVKIRMMLKK